MKIFISYASEDALIAAAVEGAFNALTSDGFSTLEVYRDVHTFQQGRPIKTQVLDELRLTDILFVVYSKKLKRSHSYTGFEVGAFSEMMAEDVRRDGKTERRIVSLFLDEAPPTEQDVLGIKLNVDSIRPTEARLQRDLGLSGDFARFLGEVSDIIIGRQFPKRLDDESLEHYTARVKTAKDKKKADIKGTIVPRLEAELTRALASVVERFSIEQIFVELRWNPSKAPRITGLRDDVLVTADSPDVLSVFGGYEANEQISWGKLKESLTASNADGVAHFINALEYVVGSALSSTPLDNDQLVLGTDKRLYRIIVTRHYAYFDGGRTMHVYFIPLLTEGLDGPAYRAFVLLRLATRFRMMFLDEGAPLAPQAFELNQMNVDRYKTKVMQFVRETAFTAGQSHTYQLDDPQKFVTFLNPGDRPANDDIAKLYADWKRETDKILAVAAEIEVRKTNLQSFIPKWNKSLRDYVDFVEPINRSMGAQAAARLHAWYKPEGPHLA